MRLVLTPKEQVHLQKAYVLAREAVQEMMYIARDRKLNSALNKVFDAADIMDMYIEPTREGQKT